MLSITRKISPYNHYDYNNPQYIILHYTGNTKDTAEANANYFYNADRSASAHYFVDDNNIYQSVEDYCGAWHIGNSVTDANNQNSIGIEMCTSGDYIVSETTENNTVELVKYLMNEHGIGIDCVTTHFGVSGKVCPNWSANGWDRWGKFLEKVKGNISISPKVAPVQEVKKEEEEMVKYIIQYENEVDQRPAEMLADAIKCCTINSKRPYAEYSKYENVIAVGGGSNFSGYTKYLIAPGDRYTTADACVEAAKKIASGQDVATVLKDYKK